ncbi:hypothetical protein J1N35_007078 [Gossypium stocksii]|uniref:MULE transposase domain-containing protein n=1 Tax=Gossypium stocksii TaxID=47602 RepID=A0A9D4AF94_9ROSI|nr:hypothetical protein J1N35_007078 [Gossypium stocksii]
MPTIKVLVLIAKMQTQFQYQVSYRKVWIATQMAIEQLYRNFDASYNELQGWIAAMGEYVPETVIELQTRPYYGSDEQRQSSKRIFHLMFWTFDPCARAFPHCKPFVQVDGTWLYGKDTQILLIAIAQNGNRNMLPIAFAIVDKENMESWEFFLTNLRSYILQVGYLDAKNGSATSQPDGGRTRVCRALYTLEHTLRVWKNEFPVLPDLSTWEVPQMTFELIPNKGLRRNPKGRSQSSRIRNEMDIREKSDGKLCGVCRLASHNRSKCLLQNYQTGQSSQSDRN